ncbi:MAG TPA: glycerophosphodiester phosphodiesterase family protein [Planctomycetota bacterium]|nr:glycerophosphodiester phosphodiesterase family protein [Planctomycetota bacterium]
MPGYRPLAIAHRGDSAHRPENTIAAFGAAIAARCDGIELDVQLSRDGVPVVCHDGTLARYGGPRRALATMTAAELAACDVGAWFAPRFRGQGVPTLDAVLRRFGRRTRLLIELKVGRGRAGRARGARLARAVAEVLARRGQGRRHWILCFERHALAAIRRLDPGLTLVLNAERPPRGLAALKRLGVAIVDLDQRRVTAAVVRRLNEAGLRVTTWTCNEPAVVRRVVAAGVDAVLSDKPRWLRGVLARA